MLFRSFVDGRPQKDLYRRYSLASATDDTDAMNQVLARRFKSMLDDDSKPDLIVVDGAGPQVTAASKAARASGIEDLPIVGIAKRLEELWQPGNQFPVILARASDELYLIQHLRDEAHRFAITYQRQKRKASLQTRLLEIQGLGEKRVAALLRHFGSVKRLKLANSDEIASVAGIGPILAEHILVEVQKS